MEENRKYSIKELITRFKHANLRLVEIYQHHDPNEIVIVIKVGSRSRTLPELVPQVEAHIRNHLVKLRKG